LARALIVGCGCRGRMLGGRLAAEGWAVRGTSRADAGLRAIEVAGIEPALADPERPATILELVGDVTVVHWLLGSAVGDAERVAAVHGARLERLLEKLVDSPVRGFIYEAAGTVSSRHLSEGAAIVRAASARWRLPARVIDADRRDPEAWATAMLAATHRLISP
jgi:uncharacterized protein YbjT (DUF2867 family)